jgi:hypothetical protein
MVCVTARDLKMAEYSFLKSLPLNVVPCKVPASRHLVVDVAPAEVLEVDKDIVFVRSPLIRDPHNNSFCDIFGFSRNGRGFCRSVSNGMVFCVRILIEVPQGFVCVFGFKERNNDKS